MAGHFARELHRNCDLGVRNDFGRRTSSLTVRTHTIRATYSGDTTFKSSSGTVKQVVEK